MNSMMGAPQVAASIAGQQIDERIRDAEARRAARECRGVAHRRSIARRRHTWRIRTFARAFAH